MIDSFRLMGSGLETYIRREHSYARIFVVIYVCSHEAAIAIKRTRKKRKKKERKRLAAE